MSSATKTSVSIGLAQKRALLAARLQKAASEPRKCPLSFAQQRLWFLDQLEPNSPLYNIGAVARIEGVVDVGALERSLTTLVERHETLRTRFTSTDETPLQVIDPHSRTKLGLVDLTRQAEVEREPAARRLIRGELNRPFVLSEEHPLRMTLIRLGTEEHRLVLIVHHIVADEWSLRVFFEELAGVYGSSMTGEPLSLPELQVQYADYARWQRQWLQGENLRKQLEYWKNQLKGFPPLTELPTDHPRGQSPTFRGKTVSQALGNPLTQKLNQLARKREATLFMILLAAFKVLVLRYTQQEDLIVCSPIAGRNRIETEGLIGFFANTLALRTSLAGDPSFEQVLARVREVTLGAMAHQDLPFDRLVEELQPERSLSHLPFTRLMFSFQSGMPEEIKLPGATLKFLEVEPELAKFELTLVMRETNHGLASSIEYNSELFDAGTISRLLNHFATLLDSIVTAPEARISQLPLLLEAERRQFIVEWNQTAKAYPRDRCIHELFEAQAARVPEALAVAWGHQKMSYGELNSRANQLARYLKHFELKPDVPVGLCVERSLEMVVGMLAILKAGGAYVPLDANYPRERLAFMLEDTGAPVVLTQQRLLERVPRNGAKVVCLDADWELIAREPRENVPCLANAGNLAYVMYTSGSSGQPKGVAVPHRAVNRLVVNNDFVHLDPSDRIAQVSNISFDAATFELWGALLNGAQIVGITRDVALSPKDFANELREQGITAMFLTAALFNQLASEAPGAFASLRTVIAGGESLDPKWVRAILNDRPPKFLVNGYGPTENTTFTCCHAIRELGPEVHNVPIGRPISNTTVFILDKNLDPVPIGVPGELYTGGDGVARGYWKRPDLTAEKFIPNPFDAEGSGVLYRTGDLARYLANGTVEFLGRIDSQVKIRGFRIELGEIETLLGQHPAVRECVVGVCGTGASDKRLVAYVVAAVEQALNASQLRTFLSQKVPEYMIPSAFVRVEALPLTANGKVDRQALPAPDQARPKLDRQYVPPRDATERQLAALWEAVLGVSPIGIQDKFFDLGGHSMLAVRVIAQIEKKFGKKLRLATLFQAPTIERLAAVLREEIKESSVAAGTSLVEIQGVGSRPPLFLVHGAGGGMFWGYINLARCLGQDQPVYGFKSRGLDGHEEFPSVEEMAAHYVADLRKVQPNGPYFLGGYCFGGNVAYEMACQLAECGEKVGLLAILNCAPPNSSYNRIPWTPGWGVSLAKNLIYWARYFGQWSATQRREFFRWKWQLLKKRFNRARNRTESDFSNVEPGDLVDLSSYTEDQKLIWETHIRALMNFHPRVYQGTVHLFRSSGHPLWCSFDENYGWGDLAKGGVKAIMVPGAHEKILEEPWVKALAGSLSEALGRVQRSVSVESDNRAEATRNAPGPGISKILNLAQPTIPPTLPADGTCFPLSSSQERIWFLDQIDSQRTAYNRCVGVGLSGPLNQEALQRALSLLAQRHDALRAVFPAEKDHSVQFLAGTGDGLLPISDLSGVPQSERERHALELAAQEARRSHILSSPVLKPLLLRFSEFEHWLVLILSDIGVDEISVRIIIRDLIALYDECVCGSASHLPPLSLRYSDSVASLGVLTAEAEVCQFNYWAQTLGGAPELLDIPADRSRPARADFEGAHCPFELPGSIGQAVSCLAKNENVGPFSVYLAALATVLHRYTGNQDIVIGSSASVRTASAQGVVGPMENPVAFRCDLSGEPSFRELVRRLARTTQGALENSTLPFGRVISALRAQNSQSYSPVFQVYLACETEPLQDSTSAGLHFSPFEIHTQTSKYDLSLKLAPNQEAVSGCVDYSVALFDRSRISRLVDHFHTLLASAVSQPDRPISELDLLPETETRHLLFEWTATEREYPRDKTLVDLFLEQAVQTPDADAVVDGGSRWTYARLRARADQVANQLRNLGVGRESLVGICHERSGEMVAAMLGTLLAGGAYVPLDPKYPKDRLAFSLQDAKVSVLLTQTKLLPLLPRTDSTVVCLDSINELPTQLPAASVDVGAKPEDLAYVIYTSGSTGKPKGVALEHRNAVSLVFWARENFTSDELSGVLASTSICFDLSVFELFVPLCCGGKVILADTALELAGLPAASEVRLINTVPSAIRELLRLRAVPAGVRVISLAGEPLSSELVDQIYHETSVRKVWDLYGPTETTTYSTGSVREVGKPATIGRPLANEQVYLLDSRLRLVPIGVPGELFIGGDGVARGYLNRPELTAEKFIPNPFRKGARLYRTGDLSRWREDGNLEYLGRLDHQVKIRGFRIELGEIETVLKSHAGVGTVLVMAREDHPGDKRLAAYVVPQAGAVVTVDDLKQAVRAQLPEFMVPSDFVFLSALPMTPNGKIDRKALPAPEMRSDVARSDLVAPRTELEEQLAGIWRDVLRLKQVSVHDNFFDLGGHSLLAVRVISAIRDVLNVELSLSGLFSAPTIAELSEVVSGLRGAGGQTSLPVSRVARNGSMPVSYVQERLWFLSQLDPASPAYNVPIALKLKGRLQVAALQGAFKSLISRHEALRVTFKYADGALTQEIAESPALEFTEVNLESEPGHKRDSRALERVNWHARQPFDMAVGPLIRSTLFRLGDTDHILLVVMHHAVSDGWSLALFFQELSSLYDCLAQNLAPVQLPELSIQYADFAQWQRHWMSGKTLEREMVQWKEVLDGAPAELRLPLDHPRPERGSGHAKCLAAHLGAASRERLAGLARLESCTPFMLFLSALMVTFQRWTGQEDQVIGTVVAGRTRRELENLVGCFMNFIPLRAQVRETDTGRELLGRVRAAVLEGQNHQDIPFEKIVEAVNPQRYRDQNPIYNVALLLQNFPPNLFQTQTLEACSFPVSLEAALLDLRFEVEQTQTGFTLNCEYKTDLFEPGTVQEFLSCWVRAIEFIVGSPETKISELELTLGPQRKLKDFTRELEQPVIAITATFTAEPVQEALEYWLQRLEMPAKIDFAPYNQVFQQLLDPASLVAKNVDGLNVILARLEDWQDGSESSKPLAERRAGDQFPEQGQEDFVQAVKAAAGRGSAPFLICFCPPSADGTDSLRADDLLKLSERLEKELASVPGVFLLSFDELAGWYPVADYYDAAGDALGRVPYTPAFFTALGTAIVRKFHALRRSSHKVVALDCDNTLWSGVCGEEGAKGVQLDDARRVLQEFMRAQRESGMLLCLCSKNNDEDVRAVYEARTDFPLQMNHFAACRLNWQPKSANLKSLARELGLGLDSFIFVDDNPVECAEVEANCPEVLSLQLPEDPGLIPQFLKQCWAFDHLKLTDEDRLRSELYQQNRERETLRDQAPTLAEFLASLDIKVEIEPIAPDNWSRVAQLTQRTNQFNFTTRRKTEGELGQWLNSAQGLAIRVRDRFGDYGLVGTVLFRVTGDTVDVETFLLSCRVLGRGIEHRLVARLGEIASEKGARWLDLHFVPTAKNKPALDFLESIGSAFQQPLNGGSVFRLPVNVAAQIVFQPPPELPQEPVVETRKAGAPPYRTASGTAHRFSGYREIALDGNDPASIFKQIRKATTVRKRVAANFAPPQNELERKLCLLWQELLHVQPIGLQDDFFELGGHSLLAVRLFAELEKIVGRKFPLVTLFQAPTIGQLARVLVEGEGGGSLLVPIQPNGGKSPLFLVHGAGGDVLWGYANLAAHLPPDQPIYGIKSHGQDGAEEIKGLEGMAREYLEVVRTRQPSGPYYLGGYCFGGNVAYEMARQLRMQGQQVALVILIDTAPANAGYEKVTWWRLGFPWRFGRNVAYWLADFRGLPVEDRRRFVGRKLRWMGRKLKRRLGIERGPARFDLEEVIDPRYFPEHELSLWQSHLEALIAHVERPYSGPVALLRTRGQPLFCSLEDDFCWGRLVEEGVVVKRIPGSHENIFVEPNVRVLAKELVNLLEAPLCSGARKAHISTLPATGEPSPSL